LFVIFVLLFDSCFIALCSSFVFSVAMNVVLRYLYVKKSFLKKKLPADDGVYKTNVVGLVLGLLSAFGLSMVANFQVRKRAKLLTADGKYPG